MIDYASVSDSVQHVKAQAGLYSAKIERSRFQSIASGENKPNNESMETRISKLESIVESIRDRLTGVETRLAVIERTMATKEDLHKEINAQTWKLVTFVCGFGSALVAAVYFITKHTG